MIHHVSIAANQPQRVAEILAEMVQGQAIPFPGHPGSYITLTFDSQGTMIEVLPQGTELTPGSEAFNQTSHAPTFNAFHAALSVSTSEAQIHEIANRVGWHVQSCDRQGYFSVIEVWIENQQLLELLPPNFAEQYLAFTQPQALKQFLAAMVSH